MNKANFKSTYRAARMAKAFALSFGENFVHLLQDCDAFESFLYHYAGFDRSFPEKVRDLICDNMLSPALLAGRGNVFTLK